MQGCNREYRNRTCAQHDSADVDTTRVTTTGFRTKSVAIALLNNQQQNITLDSNVAGKTWPTAKSAAEPRYKALATISGTSTLTGVHTPMMFYSGGRDSTVKCDSVKNVFLTVKDQPAFFINEMESDHGWWIYQGASGVSLSSGAAWFRVYLMNDTANRKYLYGPNCTLCSDTRVKNRAGPLRISRKRNNVIINLRPPLFHHPPSIKYILIYSQNGAQ